LLSLSRFATEAGVIEILSNQTPDSGFFNKAKVGLYATRAHDRMASS